MVDETIYYYGTDPQTDLSGKHLRPTLVPIVRIRGKGKHFERFKKALEDAGMEGGKE